MIYCDVIKILLIIFTLEMKIHAITLIFVAFTFLGLLALINYYPTWR